MVTPLQVDTINEHIANGKIKVVRNKGDNLLVGIYASEVAAAALKTAKVEVKPFTSHTRINSPFDISRFDYHVDVPGFIGQFGSEALATAEELELLAKDPAKRGK